MSQQPPSEPALAGAASSPPGLPATQTPAGCRARRHVARSPSRSGALDALIDLLDVAAVASFFSSLPWAQRRWLVGTRTLAYLYRRRHRRQQAEEGMNPS
jgi:hypothetical protein